MNQKGCPAAKGLAKGTVKFLLGNVEADTRLFWLGVFYVDVIFGHLQTNRVLISNSKNKNFAMPTQNITSR
jgi:hypothetical protein